MWKLPVLLVIATLAVCPAVQAESEPPAPDRLEQSPLQYVLLLALDGFSGEGLQKAKTPNIDKLARGGVFLTRSKGVMPTKSSPNWASILTGVYPDTHGIHSNQWWWFRFKRRLGYPTLFTAIKAADSNAKTAVIYEWDHFGKLFHPKDIDHNEWVSNHANTTAAVSNLIQTGMPRFSVVHLVTADLAGHDHSWTSPEYIDGIEFVDGQVGEIIQQLKANNLFDQTMLVLASDHGGVDHGHGGSSDTELYTPLIFHGPGIKNGLKLRGTNQNVDITATLYDLLELKPMVPLKGIPLKIIWK